MFFNAKNLELSSILSKFASLLKTEKMLLTIFILLFFVLILNICLFYKSAYNFSCAPKSPKGDLAKCDNYATAKPEAISSYTGTKASCLHKFASLTGAKCRFASRYLKLITLLLIASPSPSDT